MGMNKVLVVTALVLLAISYYGYDYYIRHSEAELLRRATMYWEAVRVNDLQTAYSLEAEAAAGLLQPHEVASTQDWGRRLVGYELGGVIYSRNHAEIEISKEITLPDSMQTKMYPGRKDIWTFVNGQWFHGEPEAGTSIMRKRPGLPQKKIY